MLPAAHRMRRSADFVESVRHGARAGRATLVVHAATRADSGPGPVVGIVVSKAVGTAVVRNTVKRRLRALLARRLAMVPPDAMVVVRALPPAADEDFEALGSDLDGALGAALRRRRDRG